MVRWEIVREAFPLLPKPSAGLGETEVNAICQGKKSPTFTIPARRMFQDPVWSDVSQVAIALEDFKSKILSDFSPAISNNIEASQVANFPPVKISLKDVQPPQSKRTTCGALPYHLVGEAEKHIHNLVSQGILREIPF